MVPKGWKEATIEDCAEILDSRRIPLNQEERSTRQGSIPYWGANGILDYIDDFLFDEPLILIAEDGGYFDEAASRPICHKVDGKCWINNHAHIMRAKSGSLRDWIYYYFVHRDITPFINGGTRAKLNQSDLRQLLIPLPPLPEQKRIAEVLGGVDEAIESTKAVIKQTKKVKQGLLQTLLTRGIGHTKFKPSPLGKIPVEWEVGPVNDVAKFVKSGLSRRILFEDIGVPVITSGNIQNGALQTKELKYWYANDPQGAKVEDYMLKDGDILLNFINSIKQIGKICVFKDIGRPAIYTTNIFCIRPRDNYHSTFLYFLFSSPYVQKEIQLITMPAVNQASFTKKDFLEIILPLPPLAEQKAITKIFEDIDNEITTETTKLTALQQLKKGLMHDLLTGKVRVHD